MRVVRDEGGRQSIQLSMPTLTTITTLLALLTFAGGWLSSYTIFRGQMDSTQVSLNNLQAQVNTLSTTLQSDRERNSSRLTVLESDVKYITQGVAELKLNLIPRK